MPIPTFLRFADLRERGIVNNRTQLRNLQRLEGFPTGRLIGRHTRAWTEDELAAWLDSRPTGKVITPTPPTVAKARAKAQVTEAA